MALDTLSWYYMVIWPLTVVTVQDYKNIEAGLYKLPWDMTTLRNRQYDPLHVLSTAATFATEASNTLVRRFGGAPEKVWLQSSMYPEYYLNTFHYQVTFLLLLRRLPLCLSVVTCSFGHSDFVLPAHCYESCASLKQVHSCECVCTAALSEHLLWSTICIHPP